MSPILMSAAPAEGEAEEGGRGGRPGEQHLDHRPLHRAVPARRPILYEAGAGGKAPCRRKIYWYTNDYGPAAAARNPIWTGGGGPSCANCRQGCGEARPILDPQGRGIDPSVHAGATLPTSSDVNHYS